MARHVRCCKKCVFSLLRKVDRQSVARLAVSVRVLGKKQAHIASVDRIETTYSHVALQDNAVQATVYRDPVVTRHLQLGALYDGRFA